MSKFRQDFDSDKKPQSTDGFISAGKRHHDIRKQFRQNYRPQQSPQQIKTETVKTPVRDTDGFYVRPPHGQQAVELPKLQESDFTAQDNGPVSSVQNEDLIEQPNQFDLQLDDEIAGKHKKRRFRLFGRKNRPEKTAKRSLKRKVLRASGVFFLVLLIGTGSILGYGYLKTRQIFRGSGDGAAALEENVDPARLNGEGDGRINILLLGKGGPGHEAPDLTDTILLASIDPVHDEAALLSIPRDLYVEDVNGNSSKINAVYSNAKQYAFSQSSGSDSDMDAAEDAGVQALRQTVSNTVGIPIHYYIMVDFTAFKESIDTVGGITIDVKEPLYDATMAWMNNGNPLLADVGMQTFDGQRALMYARSRYGSERGDFDRTERQREVILALQQKVLSAGTFSNPFKVVELLNTLGNNVRTDLNGTDELKRLYEIGQKIGPDKFISVGLADPPNILVVTDNIAGQSVVVPSAGLNQYEDIQSYVRNTLRDAFLREENSRIVILNGTGTVGLASVTEKTLKSYGYNVTEVGNAPTQDYTTTQLIDLNSELHPYTASYLQKRLGLTMTKQTIEGIPTTETADFVIILGSDEVIETTINQ